MAFATPPLDLGLFELINQALHLKSLNTPMLLLSNKVLGLTLAAALLTYLARHSRRKALGLLLVALLCIGAVDQTVYHLKDAFGRPRPVNALSGVRYHQDGKWQTTEAQPSNPDSGVSYPSAHAANSMALTLVLIWFWPPGRPWLLALPLLVGYSRVYLGKHYPSDILAGWLIGATIALVLIQLSSQLGPALANKWPRRRGHKSDRR
jgi:undecaprenyl-diphosphatase